MHDELDSVGVYRLPLSSRECVDVLRDQFARDGGVVNLRILPAFVLA